MSPTRVFVLLKARLVVNGVRRMTRSTWARVGFVFSLLFALVAAGVGVGIALGLRVYWDADAQHRNLVLLSAGIVFGWWFAPVLGGGSTVGAFSTPGTGGARTLRAVAEDSADLSSIGIGTGGR